MENRAHYTQLIKAEAQRLGFDSCGISKATFLENEAKNMEQWLQRGYQGSMQYMENHFDKRLDPRKLVPGAKSVISLSYNYYPEQIQDNSTYQLSKYAYGEDYHMVLKAKLKELQLFIRNNIGEINGRAFVDSAPIMERAWAEKAGLGWRGKNSLFIHKQKGSYFFLAELILDLDLEYDEPFKTDHCGSCTKCIDACPTEAIIENRTVDGSNCISYFTIELKENIPAFYKGKFEDWMFGCDICQDVCPWNRFSTPSSEPKFQPHPDLLQMTKADWQEFNISTFNELFRKSAVKRTKYHGLKRNIAFLQDE